MGCGAVSYPEYHSHDGYIVYANFIKFEEKFIEERRLDPELMEWQAISPNLLIQALADLIISSYQKKKYSFIKI